MRYLITLAFMVITIAVAQAGGMTLLGTGNGATGFLPVSSCSGNFIPANYSKNSNDFTTGWTAQNSGSTNPTITTVTDTLPDLTSGTVDKVVFGAVAAGTTNYSVLSYADGNNLGSYPTTHGVWAKVVAGAGTDFISISRGTTFTTAAITNDGAWHQIATAPSTIVGNLNLTIQLGVNQFDTAQRGGTVSTTIELTGDYFVGTQFAETITYPNVKTGGSLATTGTTPVSAQIASNCPAHTAYRDPSLFVPYSGNPFISESTTEVWRAGVSNPYVQSQFQSAGKYWSFVNCEPNATTGLWLSFCLFSTPITDGINWTEDTTNAPYLQTFGSTMAQPAVSGAGSGFTAGTGTATWQGVTCGMTPVIAPTVSSTTIASVTPSPNNGVGTGACPLSGWPTGANTNWTYAGLGSGSGASYTFTSVIGSGGGTGPSHWQLHPAFLPYGCYDPTNGVSRTFCILYSAQNPTNQSIFLAWATTIDGVYTPIGCAGPGVCSTAIPVTFTSAPGTGIGNPGIVTVINVGGATGTNYIYTISGGSVQNGQNFVVWKTPANSATTTSGNTLTFVSFSSFSRVSGEDWYSPNSSTNFIDPFIYLNHCGFYEMNYTVINTTAPGAPFTNSRQQLVSTAIADLNGMENGTWWQYPAVTIPTSSSLYDGFPYLGDQASIEISGKYLLMMNYDSGVGTSRAVMVTAPQGACP